MNGYKEKSKMDDRIREWIKKMARDVKWNKSHGRMEN
jgi:hypothetical protein